MGLQKSDRLTDRQNATGTEAGAQTDALVVELRKALDHTVGARPAIDAEPEALAAYVSAMAKELARMCQAKGLETLTFLLTMAHIEAENLSRAMTETRRPAAGRGASLESA